MYSFRSVLFLLLSCGFILSSCSPPTRYNSWQTNGAFNIPQPQQNVVSYAPAPQPRAYLKPVFREVVCSGCQGTGVTAAVDMHSPVPVTQTCPQCKGQGTFTAKWGYDTW